MKYFICSDVHGFYDEMIMNLNKAGFDKNNPQHVFVHCGDLMDRGPKPLDCLIFVNSLPKERKILIEGNHEILLKEAFQRGCCLSHDYHNRTTDTIFDIGTEQGTINDDNYWERAKNHPQLLEYFSSLQQYGEIQNYIFVHSFIPLNKDKQYNRKWRYASAKAWNDAKWVNPFELAARGLNKTKKTIVHGHWSNSTYWAKIENREVYGGNAKYNLCVHNQCIGLDTTTVLSKQVNILVIEE